MAILICYWANCRPTQNKAKLTRKSENAVDSDHVLKSVYDEEAVVVGLHALVQSSMSDISCTV